MFFLLTIIWYYCLLKLKHVLLCIDVPMNVTANEKSFKPYVFYDNLKTTVNAFFKTNKTEKCV